MATSKPRAPKADGVVAEDSVTPVSDTTSTDAAAAKASALKMKDFVARIGNELGGRKKASREVVDATLKVLADAINGGEAFILPPLGRGRVVKAQDGIVTLKLRKADAKPGAKGKKEPLATAED